MPAWGMSNAGKEAEGWPREMGAWSAEQMRQFLERQNRFGDLADFYTTGAADYWTQRRNEGFGTPGQISDTGEQISPWVRGYNENNLGRRGEIRANEAGRRTAGDVSGEMGGRLDTMGQNIGSNYSDMEGEINTTAGRMFGRNEGASTDVLNNVVDTSGSLRSAINDTWGGLRTRNFGTYDTIGDRGETTFAEQMRNLSALKPGGQAQSARVGRSFAPQIADTLTRIRRAGIDPNSPEAASLLRAVETGRSRAMDDAQADSTAGYVRAANDVSSSRLGFLTAADRERLANETSLATGQTDRSNDVTAREGDSFQREKLRSAGAANEIDRDRSSRTAENTDTSFLRGQDLLRDRNSLTAWERNAGMEDVDRTAALIEGDDAAELQRGRLEDTRFDRGTAFTGMNQQTRDNATSNLGTIGNNYRNAMFQSGQQAQGWGNTASSNYQTAYGLEAPNSGWATRLLGGVAAAGLNYLMPGAGSIVGGIPGMQSGGAQGAQGGQYGGGWGGATYPYAFSMVNPASYQMPSFKPSDYSYDPNKTRTLPNGDLQIGRRSTPQPRRY